jgi:hypothetical protein
VSKGHAKGCGSPGKRPWHRWKDLQEQLPTEDEVRGWWRRLPGSNVGVALGPVSGVVRLDVDGPGGEKLLQEWSGGDLPPTLEFTSGRPNGGRGLLYAIPPGVVFQTTTHAPVDKQELRFQAKGAQTVLPPSRHPDGPRYEWVPGRSPFEIPLAPAPRWVVERWGARGNGAAGERKGTEPLGEDEPIHEGNRDTRLTSLAGTMRRRRMGYEEIAAALLVADGRRCRPPLGDEVVRKIATSVCRYKPTDTALLTVSQSGRLPGGASVGSVGRRAPIRPLPPYQPFPLEALPPVLDEYVAAAAQAIGCDPALVALPALAAAAGAVGNARALVLKKGWTEPAVVWAMTVAESGGHKSPAYAAAVNPLMELQCDDLDAYRDAVQAYNNELSEWTARPKDERGDKPEEPREPPSYVASDTTIETLGELLRDAPKGLLVARDELDGWFQSFTRYKKGGGSDRAGWLELHRAGTLRVDRITRERGRLVVRRACASVAGTIQPAVLARALDQEALQAGLGARFLLAMPPRRRRVWTECELPDELAGRYRQLLRALVALPVENVTRRLPLFLGLSLSAKEAWVRFFNEWGQVQHEAEGEQASAFAKIEAYAPRLALLHHVVRHAARGENDRRSVLQDSMVAGIALARWFANELTRVYAMLREGEEERQTRKLVEWIAEHGEPAGDRPGVRRITVRALQQSNSRRWPSREAAEVGLEALAGLALGRWVEGPAPRRAGTGRAGSS